MSSFFAHSATLEFQAALQLLVERAQFLTGATGVAIAIKESGGFIYSAVAGDSAREAGTTAILDENLRNCIARKETIRSQSGTNSFTFVAPVLRNQEVTGFCEFTRNSPFRDDFVASVERIAELVLTAIDHRDAALMADNIGFDELIDVPTPVPSAWHAPDMAERETPHLIPAAASATGIQKCASCGFPVSTGRKLCIDCEKNTDLEIPSSEFFTTAPHESWLGEHGYTIASVLVSVLALAVIIWLRSR